MKCPHGVENGHHVNWREHLYRRPCTECNAAAMKREFGRRMSRLRRDFIEKRRTELATPLLETDAVVELEGTRDRSGLRKVHKVVARSYHSAILGFKIRVLNPKAPMFVESDRHPGLWERFGAVDEGQTTENAVSNVKVVWTYGKGGLWTRHDIHAAAMEAWKKEKVSYPETVRKEVEEQYGSPMVT